MGFSVVRYTEENNSKWGIVEGGYVKPVPGTYKTLSAFLDEGWSAAKEVMASNENKQLPISELILLSPVTRPARVVCQGLNYSDHRKETEYDTTNKPEFNLVFTKADSSITGPYNDIIRPNHVKLLDYEIELGMIIKNSITEKVHLTERNLHKYIAGLVITNDVSARDVQVPQEQYFKGKSYRTFCPTGPYLYLLDEEDFPSVYNLDIKLWVNDELRQSSNTQYLTFKPTETLTELSGLMDLSPGDVVLTGTPGGVAVKFNKEIAQELIYTQENKTEVFLNSQKNNNAYLKNGDIMKSEIKSPDGSIDLGIQQNRIVG